MPGLQVTLTNRQTTLKLDRRKLIAAVRLALGQAEIRGGSVSVAVVDDPTIHELNRRFLRHDYPTDVLSFLLEQSPGCVEGEIIVSADTARERAAEFGCTPHEELLLYVVHGALHLLGYDDHTVRDRRVMRAKERECLDGQRATKGGGRKTNGRGDPARSKPRGASAGSARKPRNAERKGQRVRTP